MWSEGVKLEVRYRRCMGIGWSVREGRGFPTEGTIYTRSLRTGNSKLEGLKADECS